MTSSPTHDDPIEASSVPSVLFVCVHNAGRSQMGAALLAHHALGRVDASAVDVCCRAGLGSVLRL